MSTLRKIPVLALVLSLFSPPHVFALRAGIEGIPSGLEEELWSQGSPASVIWADFDGTVTATGRSDASEETQQAIKAYRAAGGRYFVVTARDEETTRRRLGVEGVRVWGRYGSKWLMLIIEKRMHEAGGPLLTNDGIRRTLEIAVGTDQPLEGLRFWESLIPVSSSEIQQLNPDMEIQQFGDFTLYQLRDVPPEQRVFAMIQIRRDQSQMDPRPEIVRRIAPHFPGVIFTLGGPDTINLSYVDKWDLVSLRSGGLSMEQTAYLGDAGGPDEPDEKPLQEIARRGGKAVLVSDPDVHNRFLRVQTERLMARAGAEEPATSDVSGATVHALANRVERILEGKDPESEFLRPAEEKSLRNFYNGHASRIQSQRRYSPMSQWKYDSLKEIVLKAKERADQYQRGRRSLDTLPRLARILLHNKLIKLDFYQQTKHPEATEEDLQAFADRYAVFKGPGRGKVEIPDKARQKIMKRFWNARMGMAFHPPPSEQTFQEAFDTIEVLLRLSRYKPLRDRLASRDNGRDAPKEDPLVEMQNLRERWKQLSLDAIDRLIQSAPKKEAQPIGPRTPLRVSDGVGKKESRLYIKRDEKTLGDLRARIQSSSSGVSVQRLKEPGHYLFRILNGGANFDTLASPQRAERINQWFNRHIQGLETFIEGNRFAYLFPAITAGAEEVTPEMEPMALSWIEIEDFLESDRFALSPTDLETIASEVVPDRIAFIPLPESADGVVTLTPYYTPDLKPQLPRIEAYFQEANRWLTRHGIRFGPLQEWTIYLNVPLGLIIYGERKPFPFGMTIVTAPQVSAKNSQKLNPLLLAAKTLHPTLSWEFLTGYDVKLILLVRDEQTGQRYLAILA